MKSIFLVVVLLFGWALVGAQDWAKAKLDQSPRHGEWVKLSNGSRTVDTFVVYPERKDKAPVMLVFHEIFGMSDWAMEMADELAANGYIAIVPDLLSGMGPNGGRTSDFGDDQQKIMEAVSNLSTDQVMGDMNAAADYAHTIPSANGHISVCGFCWGGTQTFHFATVRPDLSAVYVFYGIGPQDAADIAKINAPVYGFYAGLDNRVTSTVGDQKIRMHDGKKKYSPYIFDDAGHGFMRAGEAPDANAGNKKARDDAWKRWLDLMRKHSE